MAATTSRPGPAPLDRQKLLQRILVARPDVRPEEVRRIAPLFQGMSDKQLGDLITQARKRIEKKSQQKIQRRH